MALFGATPGATPAAAPGVATPGAAPAAAPAAAPGVATPGAPPGGVALGGAALFGFGGCFFFDDFGSIANAARFARLEKTTIVLSRPFENDGALP